MRDGLKPLSVTAGVVLVGVDVVGEEELLQAPTSSPTTTAKDTDTKRLMLDSMLTGSFPSIFDDRGFLFGCPGSVIHRGPPYTGRFLGQQSLRAVGVNPSSTLRLKTDRSPCH
jgi:hypothetical protein